MKSHKRASSRPCHLAVVAALVMAISPFLPGGALAQCAAPPAGLVSWWRGETNALDQTGTNHGTLSGNTIYGAGRVGQGLSFDGNGAVVQLGNPANLHLQDLTIETWLRRASPSVVSFNGGPGNGVIFGYDNGGYGLYLDPSGVPTFSKIGFNEVKPGIAITDTNWHHLAVTKVGSTVVFHLDGVAHPAAAYDPGFTFSGNAYVGGLGSFYTFYGTVDELSVYGRALATNELQAIYNAGSSGKCLAVTPPECMSAPAGLVSWWAAEGNASDRVGNLNGSLYGGTTFGPGKVGQALSFDGVNDSVTNAMTGLTNILDTYTMEFWAWPTAARASTPEATSGIYGSGSQRFAIFPHVGPTGGIVGAGISVGTNGVSVFEAGNAYMPALLVYEAPIIGWTHIAVVYSNRRPSLYVNGVLVRSGLTSVNPSCPSTQLGERGAASANQGYYAGLLDEVSIYNRALATNEIQAVYHAGTAGKCMPATNSASIVSNGGLELLPGGTFQTVLPGGSYAGWSSVGTGDIEFDAVYSKPNAEGSGCVDLNGIGFQGAVSQMLITEPGYLYRLRFAMSGNPGLPGQNKHGDKTMTVSWGGTNVGSFVFTHQPTDAQTNMRWEYHEVLVHGTGQDELRFTSTTGAYNDAGPVIDDISVVRLLGTAPSITSHPADQVVTVGETATFNVTASGTAPLSYQWRMNNTNITGATSDSLVLTNVQPAAAGIYSVIVSNLAGAVTSSNATLTVNPLVACVSPPAGLVSWWSGNGNASDLIGANNGLFNNGAAFGGGEVGQGFSFNGGSNNVRIPASSSLDVGKNNGLTIEAWIHPADLGQHPIVEWSPGGGYGPHIWINVLGPGSVYANLIDSNGNEHLMQSAVGVIAANVFQHLAVTYDKASGMGRIIVNGITVAAANLGSFTPATTSDLYIGYRPPGAPFGPIPFNGIIDEVSLYARALSLGEVQAVYSAGSAGKCMPGSVASIVANGGLETLPGDTFMTVLPGSTYASWRSVGGGDVEFVTQLTAVPGGFFGPATEGSGCVDLNGVGFQGAIAQAITNAPGALYLLRFAMSGNPGVLGQPTLGDKSMAVTWGGTNVGSFVFKHLPSDTQTGLRWEYHQVLITGSGLDELQFTSTTGAYNGSGPLIDDITSVRVLEPFLSITSHPITQTVTSGETARFSVTALGQAPLSYQWRLNSTNIAGATADSLVLTNVQPAAAGVYSVIVSNGVGTVTSSNATLTVNALPGCVAPPAGLVAWWRGENNPADQVGGNNGTLVGNTTYGAGRVSQGFAFDGGTDSIPLGNPPSLQLQDFTIETWIQRASTTVASLDFNGGELFAYGGGGYALGILDNGTPFLSRVEVDNVMPNTAITDTNLHHLAVTKSGSTVVFYVDGVTYSVPPYNTTYHFATPVAIGARGDTLANSFLGTIDELSVYNRPLSALEIQGIYSAGGSGKCLTAIPASIVVQPANKTVAIGANTTFSVTAGGTPPFSYQWRFNGTSIINATNATLSLANVQASQAGNYSVLVGNATLPPVLSSNATLTITYPVANVRLFGTNIVSGRPVTLPIRIAANGNENAVSFSLNYTTARLNFRAAELGDFPPGTLLFVNTSQTNLGRLGVTVALPSGATFTAGTQLLAGVTFDVAISLSYTPSTTSINFGDSPMARGLTDVNALTLPATFTGGSVTLAGTDLEGDGSPRPGGSRSFTINDWVQAGRFAAKLDLPATSGEFQRADAAPRGTAGDGQIKVMDWVQAGRYFAGLDPLAAVGGPTSEVASPGPLGPDPLRELRVMGSNAIQDVAVTVPVVLQAQGNENGVGFTVSFDPTALRFQSASLGGNAQGANLNLNTNQVASGKLGLVLVLPTGSSFTAGARELAKINWLPTVVGSHPVTLSDQLVLRGVSDPAAIELPASYVAGTVVVNPHPTLLITQAGTNVALAWPALASGFNLQSSTNATVSGGWSDVLSTPQLEGDNLKVTLPLTDQTKYFRLRLP